MKTQKPLIAPTATSEDVIRRYAVTTSGQKTNTTPFLWSLTETDVNFTGLLMSGFATESKYYEYQYKDILEDDELTDATCGVFHTRRCLRHDVQLLGTLLRPGGRHHAAV